MNENAKLLLNKIEKKTAQVGVIGLGYVGLPLIRAFVEAGFYAIGYDVDEKKVSALMSGRSYIKHIPNAWIADWLARGQFEATSDGAKLAEADAILICVPTPLSESRDPDLFFVEESTKTVAKILRAGQLVTLESTTWPGTTRQVMLPILERGGLKAGEDFFLAYSPEREDPGNPDFSAAGIPKLVGGFDEISGRVATALYEKAIVRIIPVSSCEIAEAAKVVENTYRSVNIAMVNELKVIFERMGIDVWEVINAAKTKPFGYQAFYPGPGLGGHCIPIDPFYLSWVARKYGLTTRFIELSGEINTQMPLYVVRKLSDALNDQRKAVNGSKICVLGLAYKKNVDDERESPSFELISRLMKRGAEVTYNDPYIPTIRKTRHWPEMAGMKSRELTAEFLASQDAVLIATDHSDYDYDLIVRHAPLVVDTRNATQNVTVGREKIVKA